MLTAVDQDILQCSQDAEVAVNHQIHFVLRLLSAILNRQVEQQGFEIAVHFQIY
jgi:hypothetical protein